MVPYVDNAFGPGAEDCEPWWPPPNTLPAENVMYIYCLKVHLLAGEKRKKKKKKNLNSILKLTRDFETFTFPFDPPMTRSISARGGDYRSRLSSTSVRPDLER